MTMKPRSQRHRALEMLAGSPLGVTEAIILAHGFTNAMLDALVREGWRQRNGGQCGRAAADPG
jgi:hypothetical protein